MEVGREVALEARSRRLRSQAYATYHWCSEVNGARSPEKAPVLGADDTSLKLMRSIN